MTRLRLLAPCLAALLAGTPCAHAATYQIADRFALGGEGKWDYPTVDGPAHRLYLSRTTHVMVVDTATGKVAGDIGDTPGVHGIAVAPELRRGYISAGKSDQVKVFDLDTLAIVAVIGVGTKPDAILYEPKSRQVFAFNGHSDNVSVIDTARNQVVATIALGGNPEFAQADGTGLVYVNIENNNELVALEAAGHKLISRWRLPGCDGPTGLALDAAHKRSFSTCANSAMAILDTSSGRSIATLPIGAGVDGAAFDPDSQNVFSANGEGTVTIVHEVDPEHFSVAQTLPTARGAKTITLDGVTHKLYLPAAQSKDEPVPPGSFYVMVIQLEASK
jgi:YVTN family beta-propeller protein